VSSETSKDLEEKLKSLIAESRILEGAAAEIQTRISIIDATAREYRFSELTLEGLKDVKKGDEILVPMGGGSYLKAEVTDTEKVIAGIGAGIAAEKPVSEAKLDVANRIEELKKTRSALENQFAQFLERMQAIREEIEKISSKMRT